MHLQNVFSAQAYVDCPAERFSVKFLLSLYTYFPRIAAPSTVTYDVKMTSHREYLIQTHDIQLLLLQSYLTPWKIWLCWFKTNCWLFGRGFLCWITLCTVWVSACRGCCEVQWRHWRHVLTRRHVGGILSVTKYGVKMWECDSSYAKVIHRSCISSGV